VILYELYTIYLNNYLETISRLYNKDNIFLVNANKNNLTNKPIQLFLPNKGDGIQQTIIRSKTFYEMDILKAMEKYIDQNSVVVDVGSNIGNHILYFGKILEAKKIYGFEPMNDVFNVLKKNLELNELTSKVKIYNIALGSKIGKGTIDYDGSMINNLGATSIKKDENGEFKIEKLDNVLMNEKNINFIKIDVEGFEIEVLKGASRILQKYRPTIWIESFEENITQVKKILFSSGYILKEEFPGFNYLFVSA
jgi:FkbM family methyltransferase